MVGSTNVHYRGARIRAAVVAHLLGNAGLGNATDVVLAGGSAGALSVFLHADAWAAALPRTAKVVGLPDSGFFLAYNASGPAPSFTTQMRWLYSAMNASGAVPRACAAVNAADPAVCVFAEEVVLTLNTPVFALQPQYDPAQVSGILQADASDAVAVNAYGELLSERLQSTLLSSSTHHGVFLESCFHHTRYWGLVVVDGDTAATAFSTWYASVGRGGGTGGGAGKRAWVQDQRYVCAACCTRNPPSSSASPTPPPAGATPSSSVSASWSASSPVTASSTPTSLSSSSSSATTSASATASSTASATASASTTALSAPCPSPLAPSPQAVGPGVLLAVKLANVVPALFAEQAGVRDAAVQGVAEAAGVNVSTSLLQRVTNTADESLLWGEREATRDGEGGVGPGSARRLQTGGVTLSLLLLTTTEAAAEELGRRVALDTLSLSRWALERLRALQPATFTAATTATVEVRSPTGLAPASAPPSLAPPSSAAGWSGAATGGAVAAVLATLVVAWLAVKAYRHDKAKRNRHVMKTTSGNAAAGARPAHKSASSAASFRHDNSLRRSSTVSPVVAWGHT